MLSFHSLHDLHNVNQMEQTDHFRVLTVRSLFTTPSNTHTHTHCYCSSCHLDMGDSTLLSDNACKHPNLVCMCMCMEGRGATEGGTRQVFVYKKVTLLGQMVHCQPTDLTLIMSKGLPIIPPHAPTNKEQCSWLIR